MPRTTQLGSSRSTRPMSSSMTNRLFQETSPTIATLDDLATLANYSLMDTLNCDPDAKANGADHAPRQVFTGHYVPVNPTPIKDPEYVAHSKNFFHELGFADSMAQSADFVRMFSGDISQVPEPMRKVGWACGYALSIYGTEYYPAVSVPNRQRIRRRSRSFGA